MNESKIAVGSTVMKVLRARACATPDFQDLDRFEEVPVFIYGHMEEGRQHNKFYLSDVKFLGKGYTISNEFIMKRAGNLPVVFEDKKHVAKKRIEGCIYAVPVEVLCNLDIAFSNGNHFHRVQRHIVLAEQTMPFHNGAKRPIVQCYMYLGNEIVWENKSMTFVMGSGKVKGETTYRWCDYSHIDKNMY